MRSYYFEVVNSVEFRQPSNTDILKFFCIGSNESSALRFDGFEDKISSLRCFYIAEVLLATKP